MCSRCMIQTNVRWVCPATNLILDYCLDTIGPSEKVQALHRSPNMADTTTGKRFL